jgi:hypothetical protein
MTDYYCQVHGVFANGSTWSTGMHVTSNQAESALLTTWSAAINNAWTNATYGLNALYPVGTNVTAVSVATLGPTMRETSKSFLATSYPGTATGDTLPYLNAAVISLRSRNIQKKGRGRLFLPAFEETNVNNDVVIPTATARMKSAWSAVLTAIQADGSTVFVFNRKDTSALHPPIIPAFTKEVITTLFASNKPARQARRTKKIAAVYS